MNSYNYSYNVLINRLEAFAAGHLLIKRFTHGQIDLADMDQNEQYPFMHVVPNNIKPVEGAMQFDFQILFADIPRDKETKAEYQREVISDCVRLAQDLIAEVKNGLILFGFDVQLVTPPVIEPFVEEYKNTLTGVSFSLQLEVPWDWSACDIPAVWSVGGTSSGGTGNAYGITLKTNGVNNAVQNILDLVAGSNITITDNGDGSVTFDAVGGGATVLVSTEFNVNHTTATGNAYAIGDRVWYNGNVYACIAANDAILPTNAAYWTLQGAGFRLRQTPVDWNASSGDYQILNKPTIPAAQVNSDWNAIAGVAQILNKPTIPAAQVNSDWNSVSGVSEILNKPTIPAAQIQSDWTQANNAALDFIKNKPTIPAAQVNSDWNAVAGVAEILNKPTIPAAQVNSDWNAVGGVAEILNKPTIPAAQGLQDVITTDPQLTTDNTIDANTFGLTIDGTSNFTVNSTSKVDINVNSDASLGIDSASVTIGKVTGTTQTQVLVDTQKTIIAASESASANETSLTLFPNSARLKTPNVNDAVATVGQVLTLSNAATGEVEFTTVSAGGGSVTSVGLTMPSAFTVTGSPVTTLGTLAVTAAGTSSEYVRGDGQLATTPTALPPNGAASGDLQGSYPNPTVHRIHNYDMQSGLPADGQTWVVVPTPFGTQPVEWRHQKLNVTQLGDTTTVGQNLAKLPDPSAVRYLRINADNTVSALTLAQLKTDLSVGTDISVVLASNVTNVGTAYEDVTGLSFAVTAGKTYKWRATLSYTASATMIVSSNGPTTSLNNARFTTSLAATTNAISNQTAYDAGTVAPVSNNGLVTADGIFRVTASGTWIIRFRCTTAAAMTVRAGSVLEYSEVL
jgi:hypothetical protein